jgi:hypothetical protein
VSPANFYERATDGVHALSATPRLRIRWQSLKGASERHSGLDADQRQLFQCRQDAEVEFLNVLEAGMSSDLVQVRRTVPDLVRLDPLSAEVSTWLDRAYDAVRHVDEAEALILRMHQRYLLDPAEKIAASAEIAETIDRAIKQTRF